MRKTFTLVLASVLAAGGVQAANADTFTVIDDPASYITIGDITGLAARTADNADPLPENGIRPFGPTAFDTGTSTSEFNRLPLTVKTKLGEKNLELVEVCLYDSVAIPEENIAANCGNGSLAASAATLTSVSRDAVANTLTANFKSAVPMAITNIGERDGAIDADVVQTAENGNPFIAGNIATSLSPLSLSGTGADEVLSGHILFRLNQQPLNTDTWKIRVLATYGTGTNAVSLELVDEASYTVEYLGVLQTGPNARPSVNYGEVAQGGTATVEEINTGRYRANNTSDVTLNAGQFTGPNDTLMTFGDPDSLAAGEVSLRCKVDETFDDFFGNGIFGIPTKTLLSNVDYDVAGQSQFSDDLATHECELKVGTEVNTGSYNNVMTVGIGKATTPE